MALSKVIRFKKIWIYKLKLNTTINNNNLQVFSLLKFPDLSFLQLFPPRPAEKKTSKKTQ